MPNAITLPEDTTKERGVYWRRKLKDLSSLQLPFDHFDISKKVNDSVIPPLLIDAKLSQQIKRLTEKQGVGITEAIVAVFKALLNWYTNQDEIGISIAYANPVDLKQGSDLDEFVLVNEVDSNDSYIALLQKVNSAFSEARGNQLSFNNISEAIRGQKSEVLIAINQVLFLNKDLATAEDHEETNLFNNYKRQFDLIFTFSETDTGFKFNINTKSGKFNNEMVTSFLTHFKYLLNSIVAEPDKMIGKLHVISPDEKNELLLFNNTDVDYPLNKTLSDLFEDQVLKTPDYIALIKNERTITYDELNRQSNQLAHYLIEQGVKPQDNVGLLVSRSFDMIIYMFAILKAGGAYVPVEPDYPEDRQEYILRNSFVNTVISDDDYPLEKIIPDLNFIRINQDELKGYSDENPGLKINTSNLAYTIYTSGSTGRPKGVMIEHHSVVNLVIAINDNFNIVPEDRLLFVTSMCFDLSVYDIFGILSSGASIVIVEREEITDLKNLQSILQIHKITFWDSVPTTLDYLVRDLEVSDTPYLQNDLRLVFLSGDWIPVELPNRINKYFPSAKTVSLGGATEGTVWSNYYRVDKVEKTWKSIPYGKPLNNNNFYILNKYLQPVPFGVPGELYIGGVGVARGYANDKEKTEGSFKPDPFSTRGFSMYKTGDLGRMLPDGNMEFIGRKDNQVKIRGFRVELGEIESVIRQTGMVKDVIVVAKENKVGEKLLVSYFVPNETFSNTTINELLHDKLPDYMVPYIWLQIESLPLTSNGKIDKKALPEINTEEQLKSLYVAPQNELEEQLSEIWQSVLKLSKISITDNFFQIGGHSLLAMQIMAKIEEKIGKKLPISTLFRFPTIQTLQIFIQKESIQNELKMLVEIRPEGKKTPIYLIHGMGLNILNFNSLITKLDKAHPIYGLQAQGLNGIDFPTGNFSEIASEYVKELLEQNPNGPYILAGYSMGGFLAVEMRNQLVSFGKTVKEIIVIDTIADNLDYKTPAHYTHIQKTGRNFLRLVFFLKCFFSYPVTTMRHKGKYINLPFIKPRVAPPIDPSAYNDNIVRISKYYEDAMMAYELKPFDDHIHLFKAKKAVAFNEDFKYLGWKKYAKRGVRLHVVPGDHNTLMNEPNVNAMARAFIKILNKN